MRYNTAKKKKPIEDKWPYIIIIFHRERKIVLQLFKSSVSLQPSYNIQKTDN